MKALPNISAVARFYASPTMLLCVKPVNLSSSNFAQKWHFVESIVLYYICSGYVPDSISSSLQFASSPASAKQITPRTHRWQRCHHLIWFEATLLWRFGKGCKGLDKTFSRENHSIACVKLRNTLLYMLVNVKYTNINASIFAIDQHQHRSVAYASCGALLLLAVSTGGRARALLYSTTCKQTFPKQNCNFTVNL